MQQYIDQINSTFSDEVPFKETIYNWFLKNSIADNGISATNFLKVDNNLTLYNNDTARQIITFAVLKHTMKLRYP